MKKNYVQLEVKVAKPPEQKIKNRTNYYSIRAQWHGLNYCTLIITNKKYFPSCLKTQVGDELLVTGQLWNTFIVENKQTYCSITTNTIKIEKKGDSRNVKPTNSRNTK